VVRTFIDADILIHAARGTKEYAHRALEVLSDPDRAFISSNFVILEVVPKARYHGRIAEGKLYRTFFEGVDEWVAPSVELIHSALELATKYGLSAMDSIHVAAAISANVDEFITGEKPSSPFFRVSVLHISSLVEMR